MQVFLTLHRAYAKGGWAILLLLSGFGIYGAVLAHALSYLVAGSFGIVALYFLKLHSKRSVITDNGDKFLKDVKSMIVFGIPSEIGSNIASFASTSYIIIVLSAIASNVVVGGYQAASNITLAITLVSNAVTVALFPAFSSLQGRSGDVKLAFKYAVKYTSLFVAPIVMFVVASSKQLVGILYGEAYSQVCLITDSSRSGQSHYYCRDCNIQSIFQCSWKDQIHDVDKSQFGASRGIAGTYLGRLLWTIRFDLRSYYIGHRHMHCWTLTCWKISFGHY